MPGEIIPCCFAIVADNDNGEEVVAAFQHLEDAMDWGVLHFGSNSFRIRHLRLVAARGTPLGEPAGAPDHN